jgi:hypothetical protein
MKNIADSIPGIPGDPKRARYFEAYTKFVTISSPEDARKAREDYKDLFGGSIKDANAAAMSITDHVMSCMGIAIEQRGDGEESKDDAPAPAAAAPNETAPSAAPAQQPEEAPKP